MTILLDAIALPDDLIWVNEYGWSKVNQNVQKSLTGALIIQEASQTKGRTFTLKGDAGSAWITKSTLDLLKAKYDTPDLTMVLSYYGTSYNVMFDRSGNTSPLSADHIYEVADPQDDHVYSLQINFIEV